MSSAPDLQEAPPTTGLVAGNYKLIKMIGKGGMGSVWEAVHYKLNTRVAIKFIETEHAVSQEARARFEKEAMAAATIQSKHAIQIFDHGVTPEGIPFIIMEMLNGESLEHRVERLSRMSLQETARILLQVCRALARAHERGIIHRDLKPDNVFIVRDADDGEEIAKVLDFGIAKMQGAPGNPGMTSSTKTGAVLGTPFYMSPEQARGLRNVDHRTDVWSLGVIAFRCVTGKLPFDGESVGDLLVKICTAPVPVPSQVVPGIPPGFDSWFTRSMEREPDRRFGSVMELANELCFVAGIAQPGQMGGPVSHQQTVGVNAAVITPHGMMASGNGGVYSSGPQAQASRAASGYGHPQVQPSGGVPTQSSPQHQSQPGYANQPASMTGSPFTTGVVAGVPPSGGKGKVVGITVAVMLLLGGVAAATVMTLKKPRVDVVVGGGGAPSSVPTEKTELKAPEKPEEKAAEKPAEKPEPAIDTTKPETTKPEKPEHTKPGTKPVVATKTQPPPPPASAKPTAAPAPTPDKKPNKNDPGY